MPPYIQSKSAFLNSQYDRRAGSTCGDPCIKGFKGAPIVDPRDTSYASRDFISPVPPSPLVDSSLPLSFAVNCNQFRKSSPPVRGYIGVSAKSMRRNFRQRLRTSRARIVRVPYTIPIDPSSEENNQPFERERQKSSSGHESQSGLLVIKYSEARVHSYRRIETQRICRQ